MKTGSITEAQSFGIIGLAIAIHPHEVTAIAMGSGHGEGPGGDLIAPAVGHGEPALGSGSISGPLGQIGGAHQAGNRGSEGGGGIASHLFPALLLGHRAGCGEVVSGQLHLGKEIMAIQMPGEQKRQRRLIELGRIPMGLAIEKGVLGKTAGTREGLAGSLPLHQGLEQKISGAVCSPTVAGRQQALGGMDQIAGPHQVIPIGIDGLVGGAPRGAETGHDAAAAAVLGGMEDQGC